MCVVSVKNSVKMGMGSGHFQESGPGRGALKEGGGGTPLHTMPLFSLYIYIRKFVTHAILGPTLVKSQILNIFNSVKALKS